MAFLQTLNLTTQTLFVVSAIPFIYFGYHAKFEYYPSRLQRFDFFLRLICVAVAAFVLIRMYAAPKTSKALSQEIAMLHLIPLVLTLLIIAQGKKLRTMMLHLAGGTQPESKGNSELHAPAPSNKEIQRLGWDDLVIDDNLKHELNSVVELLKDPKTGQRYGIDTPKGILLNGPPGTGKTTIAKVIANTAGLSFFVLQIDEIVSKWVGESEKNLTLLFNAALQHRPAVIFIDEVDSIGKTRSGNQVWADNLLNHLLQLIDGIVRTEGIYIIAATNRADLVDPALKRAGRLNKVIEVPLPHFDARMQLFVLYLSRLHLADDIDIGELASITEGKSAADIKEICNQAGLNAFKRESGDRKRNYLVTRFDLEMALREFVPNR